MARLTRDPKLETWLPDLKPQNELAIRFALRGMVPSARGDRAFGQRVDMLREKVSPDQLAGALRPARQINAALKKHIAEGRTTPAKTKRSAVKRKLKGRGTKARP